MVLLQIPGDQEVGDFAVAFGAKLVAGGLQIQVVDLLGGFLHRAVKLRIVLACRCAVTAQQVGHLVCHFQSGGTVDSIKGCIGIRKCRIPCRILEIGVGIVEAS